MKLAKLSLAALVVLVGATGSAFTSKAIHNHTSKVAQVAHTVFSWFSVTASGGKGATVNARLTLLSELALFPNLVTQANATHTTKAQYGYTTVFKTTKAYTLWQ